MFGILFGWRKASKCKKLIKQVQCRLKLLKNKKGVITRQLREDVVQLIQNGYDQTAFNRVEQIVKDEGRMAAYEILDNFCEFILLNLSYIRKHKECPNDVNEAVSSLVFASARCGDLPELQLIRKLFGDRYGRSFETTAVELSPGNLVNSQIKEKLLTNSVSDDEKQRMINEIARDCLQPELLALEYRSDWHQNQVHDGEEKTDQSKKQADSTTSTFCESLPQLPEESIVYLDDVVELCSSSSSSSTTTDGDQRLFKFKTAATVPNSRHNYSQTETWSDSENSSTSKTSVKTEDIQNQMIKGNNYFSRNVENRSEGENWGSDKEMEWENFYKKPRRRKNCDEKMKLWSSLSNKREAFYFRAVTLPPERPKESKKVNFSRANSCPYKQPSHVHPKLPDYDDIAAKFMALKREHLQNNTQLKS